MATVTGTQTSETPTEKKTVLKGTAIMLPGDTPLSIDIPTDHQAPTGRRLSVNWTVVLIEEDNTP